MNRILIVAPQPFFSVRGTPINVRALATDLTELGYSVEILSLPFGQDVPGLKISRVPRVPFFRGVPIGPSLAKVIYLGIFCLAVWRRRKEFDLIHGIEEGAFAAGIVGVLARTPYIVDVDSCMPTQLASSLMGRIPGVTRLFAATESFFLRRATAALTVCSALTEKVRKVSPSLPIFQIEDFPLEDALKVDQRTLERLEERFAGRRIALYTGNLEPYQGVELLIESFRTLQDQQTTLVIVGGNKEQISRLEQRSGQAAVVFEGSRPTTEMGAYMAAADFLLSPRLHGENVPLKLYTYMAAGKPLVATSIPSHTQILDESIAFMGEPTAAGFTAALSAAFSASKSELELRTARALDLVKSRYSRSAFKGKLAAAYQELLPLFRSVANG